MNNYLIRGRQIGDIEFVTSSWLNFAKQYTGLGKSIAKNIFMTEHHKIIKNVLNDSKMYVCYDPECKENILGYAIVEHLSHADVIHFMFVKKALRDKGVGKSLIGIFKKRNFCIVTHHTHKGKKKDLFAQTYETVEYNPYRFLNGDYRHD